MAGRIRDEDVALVKERTDIADLIGERVTLRSAGGGNLKGLCPFHDEKSPSFSVRPSVGAFHCFGCGVGGDAISFLMQLDSVSFAEAVEQLAGRAGLELHYEDGDGPDRAQAGARRRLLEAHRAAAEFYAGQLLAPEAIVGRRFLSERGFDRGAAERFGVGFAPRDGEALVRHLRGRGFRDDELVTGGLAGRGSRGLYDRFRGRLVWPIRDSAGAVLGFGARRVLDDDRIEAKYLNTAETPIYKKSQVLYGLDLARREIAKGHQAVVVEGYTDVMAAHLSGVPTAVATCGTAFGEEHARVLRRLLLDDGEVRGEVVFTFDGDEAGQRAALRAFELEEQFSSQTFVAVEPDGLDPCDVRLRKGPEAVRELVRRRVPLFEFAIRSAVGRYDLDTAEGRVAAARAGMDVVRRIRTVALRTEYARRLAGWVGMADPDELVRQAGGTLGAARRQPPAQGSQAGDPQDVVQREALKLALQAPEHLPPRFDELVVDEVFPDPAYAAAATAVRAAGGVTAARAGEAWVSAVREAAGEAAGVVAGLAVEPLLLGSTPVPRYAGEVAARLEMHAVERAIPETLRRLQQVDPADQEAFARASADYVRLESARRTLRERAMGEG
ncbi:DNA primase [Motilibacter rhizosphaerae]|uniref:DNA primase n=1 Tax=Motilibacter rhizosphaerae TaxID=598652 RepID=A0A4Q7NSE9_9ACTN|nr:DNA primase [Motilibacter rhizosphaerae]RZS89698.1 DNA primase [Motilibacter rhizosphaerae]